MRLLVCSGLILLSAVSCAPAPPPPTYYPPPVDVIDGGDCPAVTGPPTSHASNITTNQTWTAAQNPHVVPSDIRVEATLTLEPCVVVSLADGAAISVGNSSPSAAAGKIVAHGTYDSVTDQLRPVLFVATVPGTHWGSLFVGLTGSLDFEIVGLVGGGKAANSVGTVEARGTQSKPLTQSLRFLGVVVAKSGTQGIVLKSYAAFTDDSDGVIVQGAGDELEASPSFLTGFPIDVQPPAVHTIPAGIYTGNRRDAIYVRGATRADLDETFHERGVPYIMNGTLLMYDLGKSLLTLTIDPGVTIAFEHVGGGSMALALGNKAAEAPVKLVAAGTAAKPILLTSAVASPQAGDWGGVQMAFAPTVGNSITNTTIEYAGGFTGNNGFDCGPQGNVGGLVITEWRPSTVFVQSSTFRHSLGAGIVSGWTTGVGETGPDLTGNNVFLNIQTAAGETGHCNVTLWKDSTPAACPVPRPACAS